MAFNLEFTNNITSKNNNFFLFVSNLSQLKSLNLPIKIDDYLKNSNFISLFKHQNPFEINNIKISPHSLIRIKIFNLDTRSDNFIEIGADIYKSINKNYSKDITFVFSDFLIKKHNYICSDIIFGLLLKSYKFNKYLTKKNIKDVTINLFNLKNNKLIKYNMNLLDSINFCKNLVSEPANILNPITYSEKCKELRKIGLKIKILNKNQLMKIGMRSLLAVAQGSDCEPRVVICEWNLKKNTKPTVLVGKGVTFDTGGISLKPSQGMEEMITDMGGSAVVVGSMMNAALNNSSHSLIGIIGLVENMPDGKAQRPGDIVTSLSGQTIEVLNTDAEGRLVLADILTYIQSKYKPKQIIDFATLTGAIMIALGTHRAGLFSNNNILSKKLEIAGEKSGEKIWRLPLGEEYNKEINSFRADMKNIGSTRFGGSIQAAQFIQRFIHNNIPWAHLDIAGVSWTLKSNQNSNTKLHSPGASAFGVRLIDQFLRGK